MQAKNNAHNGNTLKRWCAKACAYVRDHKKSFIVTLCGLVLIIANIAARRALGDNNYGVEEHLVSVSKAISNLLRSITNLLPFSLTEVLAFLLVLMLVFFVVMLIISIVGLAVSKARSALRKKRGEETEKNETEEEREPPGSGIRLIASLCCVIALALTYFNLAYGFSFARPTIDMLLSLDKTEHSAQQLYDVALYTVKMAETERREAALEISPDATEFDFSHIRDISTAAFKKLQNKYPAYEGMIARPKPVYFSTVMSKLGISGVYSPFLSESSISVDGIAASIPFTITHELAHGVMYGREDEANFAAFLACIDADNSFVRYSGYYRAYTYLANALYGADEKLYMQLIENTSKDILGDRYAETLNYRKHQSKLTEVSEKFNDTFIKATGQEDGIRSYGNVADLILAYYDKIGIE